jgi:DNA-binding response OmpR family regulator
MTATGRDSDTHFFAVIEEQEVAASEWTAVLKTSAADQDRVCELLQSLGYTLVGFGLSESLAASLQQGTCCDPLIANPDGSRTGPSNDARALRRAADTSVPLLVVREAQPRAVTIDTGTAIANFISAPYSLQEHEARQAGPRYSESPKKEDGEFRRGCYYFKPHSCTVHFQGKKVRLQPMEFDLARRFFLSSGEIHSRAALLRSVWGGIGSDSKTRTLDIHVSRLRRKLDLGPHRECELITVHNVGYQLKIYSSRCGE